MDEEHDDEECGHTVGHAGELPGMFSDERAFLTPSGACHQEGQKADVNGY